MKQKDLLIILVSLFVLSVLWVVFNIYHSFVTSTIKDSISIQIIPIEGKFDTDTVSKIKGRKRVVPLFELQTQRITEIPLPTEEAEDEESSESAEVLPTEIPEENE